MCDGDAGDFHLSNIKRLANKVTNAIKAASKEDSNIVEGITPNKAVVARERPISVFHNRYDTDIVVIKEADIRYY